MTNDECQMTKEARHPKHEEFTPQVPGALRSFGLCHSFDICHLSFVIRSPSPIADRLHTPSASLLKNPGTTALALLCGAGTRSLARLPVACRDLETRHQQDVHDLVFVGSVMAVNENLASAGSQGDVILMFHEQPAAVSHMNEKRSKRSIVKQLPDFIGFHAANVSRIHNHSKNRKRWDRANCLIAFAASTDLTNAFNEP
jgi:hypothetical protein